ncbi:helix-turn-helix transcriptional regulator [Oenococcus sp. UCMA 17063]|nr:helix-turn-helix transcriptional regulator [Oenococcus sp. UCMA 17063]
MAKTYNITSSILLKETDFREQDRDFNRAYFDTSTLFHIRFIENLTPSEIVLNERYMFLRSNDVILVSSNQEVLIKVLNQPAKLTVFSEEMSAPSPLNLVVVGDNPMVHDLMNAGENQSRYIVYHNQGDEIKKNYFDLLTEIENQNMSDPFIQFQREMISGLLLTELLRNHRPSISISDSYFPNRDTHHASKDTQAGIIFNYLVDHSKTATLRNTASHFKYEKNYFSRLCRQLFDMSFTKQLALIRIELAKRMLALSDKSIEEISYELGYKNLSSFFVIFKRSCEITPKEYRKIHSYAANDKSKKQRDA